MQPKQKTESVLLSLLVILVLVGIYFWNKNSSTPTYPTVSDQVTTTNTTPVVPVDTSTTNFGVNLPDGFPSDIILLDTSNTALLIQAQSLKQINGKNTVTI
jgi:flagellar basal body-associated protein FliL